MRKQNQAKGLDVKPVKNPVAKFARQFNKAQVYADKSKYCRKNKHSGLEPFSIASIEAIEKGFSATSGVALSPASMQSSAFAA
jgi:hypothetical protein